MKRLGHHAFVPRALTLKVPSQDWRTMAVKTEHKTVLFAARLARRKGMMTTMDLGMVWTSKGFLGPWKRL